MEYKDFDLTVFFQGVQGNDIFNQKKYTYYFDYSNNVVKEAMNGWTKTNRNTGIPIMKPKTLVAETPCRVNFILKTVPIYV